MNVTPHDGSDCITERQTEHGYWWRYEHSDDEPLATLEAAIIVAGDVAAEEALKSGKTYFVARAACSPAYLGRSARPRCKSCRARCADQAVAAGEAAARNREC